MKISIGFITYNETSLKYLPFFLNSLKGSLDCLSGFDFEIIVLDNSVDFKYNYDYVYSFLSDNNLLGSSTIIRANNLGFSKGFNLIINKAVQNSSDLFLALNPDTFFEQGFIRDMIDNFNKLSLNNSNISSLSPTIMRWDFDNNIKTNQVDSLGIGMNKYFKFFDIGQGRTLNCKGSDNREILGVSGAAALFRVKALLDVSYYNGVYLEFFDELMFMYKEDVDLAIRLRLANWESYCLSDVVIYHDRSLSSSTFRIKDIFLKKSKTRSWSLLNQLIIIYKYRNIYFNFKIFVCSLIRSLLLFFYCFLFNNKQFFKFINLKLDIDKKRKKIKIERYSMKKIVNLIENN